MTQAGTAANASLDWEDKDKDDLVDTKPDDDWQTFVEAMDEEEFCRWTVLRGPEANILVPSSLFMAARPFSSAAPHVVFGWKDKGGATAVIRGDVASFVVVAARVLLPRSCSRLCPKGQG